MLAPTHALTAPTQGEEVPRDPSRLSTALSTECVRQTGALAVPSGGRGQDALLLIVLQEAAPTAFTHERVEGSATSFP